MTEPHEGGMLDANGPVRNRNEVKCPHCRKQISEAGLDQHILAKHGRPAPSVAPWNAAIEAAAKLCEDMCPHGGRQWTSEQLACFSALTDAAKNIRALTQPDASREKNNVK